MKIKKRNEQMNSKSRDRLLKKLKENRLNKNLGDGLTAEQRDEVLSELMRQKECVELTGLTPYELVKLENKGVFPRRINISANRMGWDRDEVMAWINDRNIPKSRIQGTITLKNIGSSHDKVDEKIVPQSRSHTQDLTDHKLLEESDSKNDLIVSKLPLEYEAIKRSAGFMSKFASSMKENLASFTKTEAFKIPEGYVLIGNVDAFSKQLGISGFLMSAKDNIKVFGRNIKSGCFEYAGMCGESVDKDQMARVFVFHTEKSRIYDDVTGEIFYDNACVDEKDLTSIIKRNMNKPVVTASGSFRWYSVGSCLVNILPHGVSAIIDSESREPVGLYFSDKISEEEVSLLKKTQTSGRYCVADVDVHRVNLIPRVYIVKKVHFSVSRLGDK